MKGNHISDEKSGSAVKAHAVEGAGLSDQGLNEAILESISDGVFTVDLNWKIRYFNRAAEKITGIDRSEAIGRPCSEVFRSSVCETGCALRRTLESGEPVISRTCYIVDAAGDAIPVSVSTAVLRDHNGTVVGGAETFRDLSEVETLRRELMGKWGIGDIVSRSRSMAEILDLIPAVAESSSTLLICGETGTGKELVARAVHNLGPRAEKPFVAINCAAIPEGLIESELFGHARGAFTGAVRDRAGRFSAAGEGTLFLDEIGELPISLQVKLLRVLQERVFEAVGSDALLSFKGRLIAATNRDLGKMVDQGLFRKDLYYRIDVVRLDLPPLRERVEDIPLLAWHFVKKQNVVDGAGAEGISPDAIRVLMEYDWPGNIRELENAIERAGVLSRGRVIEAIHLPERVRLGTIDQRHGFADAPAGPPVATSFEKGAQNCATGGSLPLPPLDDALDGVRKNAILKALERNSFKGSQAARELGIHKTTLYRWMKELDINPPLRKSRKCH